MAAPHRRKDARLDLGRKPAPLTLIMLAGRGDVAAGGSRRDGAELRRRIQRCAGSGSGPAGAPAARAAGAAAARPAGLGLHQRARAARSAGSEELGEGLGAAPPRRCRRHPPLPPPAELSGSGGAAEPPPAPSLQGGVTPRP